MVSQASSDMRPNLLILGGTLEATALAAAVHAAGHEAVLSLAGRVERPAPQPVARRIGGFGGCEGLGAYLRDNGVTHLIDATHPFAVRMSANAVAAAGAAKVPLIALTRPPWLEETGDRWQRVPDVAAAVAALAGPARRVMLAIGRMHLAAFAAHPQHHYLLRLVDPPTDPLPLSRTEIIVSRGPFTETEDRALMEARRIDMVVSKNSGGGGAYAKIASARALGLPVVMIDRPPSLPRLEVMSVTEVMDWIAHAGADRGV